MRTLFILNDPPYGTERVYNALRLAHALAKNDGDAEITVFLMADAVLSAKAGQKTPDGFYNVERMLKRVIAGRGKVLLCGTCMDARGLTEAEMMEGVRRSTMDELAAATIAVLWPRFGGEPGAERLGSALGQVLAKIRHCEKCNSFSEDAVCELCRSPRREGARPYKTGVW